MVSFAVTLLLAPALPVMSFAPTVWNAQRRNFNTEQIVTLSSSSVLKPDVTTLFVDEIPNENRNIEERNLRFAGVGRLYSKNNGKANVVGAADNHLDIVDQLAQATVAVVGLGGVGSWAAEALCRSGVGNIVLIDMDDICISNTNRQLHATSSTVGQLKIDEMRKRLLDINPQCNVTNIFDFVTIDNVYETLDSLLPELSVCLDAIDGSKEKTALIAACVARNVPIITCGGAAGRLDPTKVVCDDITKVSGDRLLAGCRRNLRKRYGFARGISLSSQKKGGGKPKKWGIEAVFSTETTKALPNGDSGGSSLRRCDGALGTACFVTGTFGFVAASKVVDTIVSRSDRTKADLFSYSS